MELNNCIEEVQTRGFIKTSSKIENSINNSISKIGFLIDAILDEDIDKIKNESVGWVFVDLIANNMATEEKPIDGKLIECSYSEYSSLNKKKLIELLLRLSLNLSQDQSYNNANIFFAINVLFAVCDFYGLSLGECVGIELNKEA